MKNILNKYLNKQIGLHSDDFKIEDPLVELIEVSDNYFGVKTETLTKYYPYSAIKTIYEGEHSIIVEIFNNVYS